MPSMGMQDAIHNDWVFIAIYQNKCLVINRQIDFHQFVIYFDDLHEYREGVFPRSSDSFLAAL
jgi:hypothetical protein